MSLVWFDPRPGHSVYWKHAARIDKRRADIIRKSGDRCLGGCEVQRSQHGGFYVYTNDPEAAETILNIALAQA
jgi:hypothetical protein